ncbi:hypothetical protein BDV18DRAFT_138693 [Aspergillus unguis]
MPSHGPPAVPSRNALRVLRNLALAGSTVGGFTAVAAITYDAHRRVSVAERIVDNKRALQTSAPRYDATSSAQRLSRMMEAAEAGEFMGLEAWKERERMVRESQVVGMKSDANPPFEENTRAVSMEDGSQSVAADQNTNTRSTPEVPEELATDPELQQSRPKPRVKNEPPSQPPLPSLKSKYSIRRSDSETDTVTIESDKDKSSANEQPTLVERMQWFLERGQYIDAAQVFLDGHPATIKGISSDRRELATQAFFLNCRQDNVFIARSIFERLEEVDRISPTMWRILIVSLAKKGCIESAATVYLRYRETIPLPGMMLDVVLRCLIESRRLTSAKWVLTRNLSKDRDCGLCGAYLTGLWKKTRSIDLLNTQFTKLLMLLRRLNKRPTEKLINPMIKTYVECGKFADAEALVHEMTTTYRVQLGCRTKGLLVYGKALQCDWVAVDEGLDEMRDLGFTSNKKDFNLVFDRIFLEYWPSHTASETRDFLYRYIDKFDIAADQVLYRHIMEAIIEKGNSDMVLEFADLARQRGWQVEIKEDEFLDLLRSRRSAMEDSPVGFWQMLQAAREEYIRSTTSQQLLGSDRRSLPLRLGRHGVSNAELPGVWFERTLDELTQPSRPVDKFQKLHKQMTHYMHAGKMAQALECFHESRQAGFHLKPLELELALIATILEHGPGAAKALAESERSLVEKLPVFYRQITETDPSAEAEFVKMAVFRFYRICWLSRTMTIKHHITASTSRRLIATNKPEIALDLLVSVYTSKYGRLKDFDSICIKMLLRAFAATNDLPGIRWCILTAIARGSARDMDLAVEVHRVMGVIRREAADTSMPVKQAVQKKKQLHYLGFAGDILHKKCKGDPTLSELRGNPALKKSFRRKQKGYLDEQRIWLDKGRFQQVIEEWDEEYELDRVLHRLDNDMDSILARWDETVCRGQETVV